MIDEYITEDGDLYQLSPDYINWSKGDDKVVLDGEFSAAQLKEIADYIGRIPK